MSLEILKKKGYKRYKDDVGKLIGGCLYVHKDYSDIFPQRPFKLALSLLGDRFPDYIYVVIKWDRRNGTFSFQQIEGFDSMEEPLVVASVIIHPTHNTIKRSIYKKPKPYHHKWMMVRRDYRGFRVWGSQMRSLSWIDVSEIDKSRIGSLEYWEMVCMKYL